MRILWLWFGMMSLAAGIAGVVLPLVPTTPFLLLSAFAFSRSSPRLEAWLVGHPRFGGPIRDWRGGGAISRRNKVAAVAAMALVVALAWAMGVGTAILIVQCCVLIPVAVFLISRPEPAAR